MTGYDLLKKIKVVIVLSFLFIVIDFAWNNWGEAWGNW